MDTLSNSDNFFRSPTISLKLSEIVHKPTNYPPAQWDKNLSIEICRKMEQSISCVCIISNPPHLHPSIGLWLKMSDKKVFVAMILLISLLKHLHSPEITPREFERVLLFQFGEQSFQSHRQLCLVDLLQFVSQLLRSEMESFSKADNFFRSPTISLKLSEIVHKPNN